MLEFNVYSVRYCCVSQRATGCNITVQNCRGKKKTRSSQWDFSLFFCSFLCGKGEGRGDLFLCKIWNKDFIKMYVCLCFVCGFFFFFFFLKNLASQLKTSELHEITHNVKEMQEEKGEPLCKLKTKIVLVLGIMLSYL